jgi:dTDP-4-dehydrorhamnose reductase
VHLVVGKGGQLGTSFGNLLGSEVEIVGMDRLDLVETDKIFPTLDRFDPETLINCAAATEVDAAEDDENEAYLINAVAVEEMTRWAKTRRIPFVTFSSDYVFPGTRQTPYFESDEPDPVNVYGASKLAGERAALDGYSRSLVVRTSWLVSGTHPNFLSTIIRKSREGPVSVVDDQVGVPNIADDLAVGTMEALAGGVTGLLHLSSSGEVTWCGFAREALVVAGMDPDLIQPASTSDYRARATRPQYGVLSSDRDTGVVLPSWRDSLPGVVQGILTWAYRGLLCLPGGGPSERSEGEEGEP